MAENQTDLVLSPNEFAYVWDKTKGNVSCWVGPSKTSLSQTDALVRFNNNTKQFEVCERYKDAIQVFCTAPEGWYIALKNPSSKHPNTGTSNSIPDDMRIGCKVNISGPANFALYPGQMAQIIRGHSLRSNQYLIAKVYDADTLNKTFATDTEGADGKTEYINGQTMIIKGTEISFYIPPTGIEVKPIHNDPKNGYVRDAVTLERLEYCILKDEDGNKRYVNGPEVVFPSPTESFIQDNNGNIKRNAIELSDISGVYVKVIADYKDEAGTQHKAGEELFITGKDQMIYYPRPEHTFISYNGKIVHHAIAIPKGEGRYVMNRLTGEIKTIHGPAMYLPDPRVEVIAKRILTKKQCELWYPGNDEVLRANGYDFETTWNCTASSLDPFITTFCDSTMMVPQDDSQYNGTRTKKETNKINRSNTFTQPRTISLGDSKYEGAVAVDIWTGYAVNVISKDGTRKVTKGPQTVILDYDQVLETLETSKRRNDGTVISEQEVFLKHENNQIIDVITVSTSDFVYATLKLSYRVDFAEDKMDDWFSVDNYTKLLRDWARSTLTKAIKYETVSDFYENYQDMVYDILSDGDSDSYLHRFEENGMLLRDVEVLSVSIEDKVLKIMEKHQMNTLAKSLELTAAQNSAEAEAEIITLNKKKVQLAESYAREKAQIEAETRSKIRELQIFDQMSIDEEEKRKREVEIELEDLKAVLFEAEQERLRKKREADLAHKEKMDELEMKRQSATADAIQTVLISLGPDLASALNNTNNQKIAEKIAEAVSPYAIAQGESVSETVDRLVRGTTLENVLGQIMNKN